VSAPCVTTFATFAATTPCNDVRPAQRNTAYCEYRGEWGQTAWQIVANITAKYGKRHGKMRQTARQNAANITAKYGKHHGKTGQTRRSAPTLRTWM